MKKHKNIFPLLLYLNTFDCEIVQVAESLSHGKNRWVNARKT